MKEKTGERANSVFIRGLVFIISKARQNNETPKESYLCLHASVVVGICTKIKSDAIEDRSRSFE